MVKNLLKEWKCDIVCFEETKLDSVNVKSLWSIPFVDWEALDAIHTARGVLLAWDTRVYKNIDCMVGCFFVSVLLQGVVDGFAWICTGVYGPILMVLGMLCGLSLIV